MKLTDRTTHTPTVAAGFVGAIGSTPLIHLAALSARCGAEIYGKAEFMNPGGSVKDRAALGIISAAESQGLIGPGSIIVEGTAGNTGIGLTHVARAKGMKSVIVIPDTQSPEKIEYLRAIGADVRPVPAAPYKDPANYNHVAKRLAAATPGAYWADQFDNVANREFHHQSTGPEIWRQTAGKVAGFVAAVGTGGTLAGTSAFLKEKNTAIKIGLPDPYGAAMHSWFTRGELVMEGSSITEGIGQGRVTKNIAGAPVDLAWRIDDLTLLGMLHYVLATEGLFLGSSAAINLCGAYLLGKELGKGKVVATILCDGGARYLSRLFNREWLTAKNLADVPAEKELFSRLDALARA